jgi:hypothetical protein
MDRMTIPTPATLPNSADSDPRVLGWMTGFPPPQDKAVIFADGSFHKFPQLRWHVRAPCAATAQSIDAGELGPPRRAFLGTGQGTGGRQPGSGRKKGSPNKITREIKEIAHQYGPGALKELARIATQGENEAARVAA